MVKKSSFTTSNQVKNTLREVSLSLSRSTLKRQEGLTRRFKPLDTPKNMKARVGFTRKQKSVHSFGQVKVRLTCYLRRETGHNPKHTSLPIKHGRSSYIAWTTDRSSRINCEVSRAILSAPIETSELLLTMEIDNDSKYTARAIK